MNNIISLALGLTAWALPLVYLAVQKRRDLFCCGSLTACGLSLFFQLREVARRVALNDYAAIEDTIGAVHFCAAVLLAATLVLNAITLLWKER